MGSIIRFGFNQGTDAGERVPVRFDVPGTQFKVTQQSSNYNSMALRKAKIYQSRVSRPLRPFLTLRDLGL